MQLEHGAIPVTMAALHFLAGFIVLAEGLNKLERINVFERGLGVRARVVLLLKACAWICLCMGAAGALARPFVVTPSGDFHIGRLLVTDRVSLADLLVLGGFAVLIVRSRFKELKK